MVDAPQKFLTIFEAYILNQAIPEYPLVAQNVLKPQSKV
jgi:hypothetical protein